MNGRNTTNSDAWMGEDANSLPFQVFHHEPYKQRNKVSKSPSIRAIRNYNNLSTDDTNAYDNMTFLSESENFDKYEDLKISNSNTNYSDDNVINNNFYDPSLRSYTPQTLCSNNEGSELDAESTHMGSRIRLVSPKVEISCQTWFTNFQTVICTISLAAGLGNLYRLPQTALANGGLPFLIAYIILMLLVGLPLLFLELGIGQLAEEGFIKSWRAVPFFKGVGYVKLLAGCLLTIYYPLYMGLSLFYVIWMMKGPVQFQECAVVKLKETGYSAENIDRQQCLRNTFLESPFKTPFWYGVYACILVILWCVIILLSIRRTKSFTRSLQFFLIPTIICFVALTVKAGIEANQFHSLTRLINDSKWDSLYKANVWYYAAIQVFFSTTVGFGTFITNAGVIYNKVNPLWIASGYISVNLIFGIGSVIMCYALSGNVDVIPKKGHIFELHLITLIYDIAVKSTNEHAKTWALLTYWTIIFVGFISMVTTTYTLLKVITSEGRNNLKWWQSSIILSFCGFLAGCAFLLKENFQLVHLVDHYIVGNLILISVVIEVFALVTFYGTERIKSDFEFMLGYILSRTWLVLWWLMPVLLSGIFVWSLVTLPLGNDPEWLCGVGWAIVLVATIFIFVFGIYTIMRQDSYSISDKIKSAFKPSNNWGPKDPMLRHAWLQWCTKVKQGEKDFTLKRRGTRDYTRSIKRETKKFNAKVYKDSTNAISENDNNNPINQNGFQQDHNNKNNRISENGYHVANEMNNSDYNNRNNALNDVASSDAYGTFTRKGPYVISDNLQHHVCHKKFNQSEELATEL